MKRKTKRLAAFSLAVVLGVAGVTGYGSFTGKDMAVSEAAGETEKVYFAEGAGTGEDFSTGSWKFAGKVKAGTGSLGEDWRTWNEAAKPGIVEDTEYLKDSKSVIRLIKGVKAKANSGDDSYYEADDSYTDFRTGEAFVNKGFKLDTDGEFSVKFTFSMPEAVVNVKQTNDAHNPNDKTYAREVGGDGIVFVMTTDANHQTMDAGSGIGYQGMGRVDADNPTAGIHSLAVELDSYFNGAYCDMAGSLATSYPNWNFDNQLYFHGNGTDGSNSYNNPADPYAGNDGKQYVNYVNPDSKERFDHIAILRDGIVRNHKNSIYYINQLDPTKKQDNKYVNLAGRYTPSNSTSSANASSDAACNTRFADAGVDTRLFTVWVDYDGVDMKVYYANGDYTTAIKPGNPQITKSKADVGMADLDGKTVYIGFTSAVGTSKANHTIHSFSFANTVTPAYQLNYWVKQSDGTYKQVESSSVHTDKAVGESATASDIDAQYNGIYTYEGKNYQYSDTASQQTSVTLAEAGKLYKMNVYYDPVTAQQAKYKLNYYKLNPVTGDYELSDSTTETVGNVGSTYTVTDVDPAYSNKYSADGYTVNTAKNGDYTVTLNEANKTYVMNVYYDPQKTTYKTEHYLKQEDGTYKLQETVPGEETYAGKPVSAVEKEYPGYTHVKTGDSVESATVQADGSTTLKVYYDPDPVTPAYRLNYHKLNPNTGEYEYITSTGTIVGSLNDTKTITDADPNYEEKYRSDGYEVNNTKNGEWSVELTETDQIYDMHVYYDPKKVSYKTNYYLKQSDGTYKLKESVPGQETYAGTNVDAQIKTYDGYQHVTTPDTLETATVDADGTTTLKVYYDPEPKTTYKVQYYVQQPDGTYKLYEEKKDLPGTIGETVTAQIITINGYVHTTTSDTIETATVNADGTTVLKVYYNLEQVVQPTTEPTTQPTTQPTTEPEEEEPEEPDEEEEEEEETPAKKANKPKTGDETNIAFLLIVTATAGAVGGICLYFRKKEDD